MVKFDNYKDRIGSDGDLSFQVNVGDTVLLTSGNRSIRVRAKVTDINTPSTDYLGVIFWSDVQEDDKANEALTEGKEVGFTYDEIAHVRHPETD